MEAPRGCYQVSKYLAELELAVEIEHECVATPVATMPVQVNLGDYAWGGMIVAFDLHGHLFAERCYAWAVVANGGVSPVTMLKVPPIFSAEDAVRIWLRGFARRAQSPAEVSWGARLTALARVLFM